MLPFPAKLQALTTEYGQLQHGTLTPQQRGQRFNAFIAEMLQAWGIPATANQRGAGEIDVAFDLNGRSFLIEAKWEQTPTNIDPIAKLQKRLRQRLAGTIGVVLSMEGYTEDALRDIKDGDPLAVLLLTRTHLEAMLSGFIRPHELFGGVLRRATVQGDVLVEDMQLLFESSQDVVAPMYGQIPGISSPIAVALSQPPITATTLISHLPFGQNGVVEQTPGQLIVTLQPGIYTINYQQQTTEQRLGIPNCTGSAVIIGTDIFVARRYGVAKLHGSTLTFIGGACGEIMSLFKDRDDNLWMYTVGHDLHDPSSHLIKLGTTLGDEQRFQLDGTLVGAAMTAFPPGQFILVGNIPPPHGGAVLLDTTGATHAIQGQHINLAAVTTLLEGRVVATNGQGLFEISLQHMIVDPLAELNFQCCAAVVNGSIAGGGYLFTHYTTPQGRVAGAILSFALH